VRRRAGRVVARRDVGAGEPREPAEEAFAAHGIRDVAAEEEEVAVGGERVRPRGDRIRTPGERRRVQRRRAEVERTVAAVREDVHRGEPLAGRQRFADLRDPVARRVEDDDFDHPVRPGRTHEVGEEAVAVGDRAVDERELVRLEPHRDARRRIERLERAMLGRHERGLACQAVEDRGEIGREQQPRFERLELEAATRGAAMGVLRLHLPSSLSSGS